MRQLSHKKYKLKKTDEIANRIAPKWHFHNQRKGKKEEEKLIKNKKKHRGAKRREKGIRKEDEVEGSGEGGTLEGRCSDLRIPLP